MNDEIQIKERIKIIQIMIEELEQESFSFPRKLKEEITQAQREMSEDEFNKTENWFVGILEEELVQIISKRFKEEGTLFHLEYLIEVIEDMGYYNLPQSQKIDTEEIYQAAAHWWAWSPDAVPYFADGKSVV